MKKIKLEPFEIQLAADVATRRFVENQKMGWTFGHGYKGSIDKTIALGVSGACAELAFCKAFDKSSVTYPINWEKHCADNNINYFAHLQID